MNNIDWTVKCLSTPVITRHCKKCNKDTAFISSDCFRVNAQGKSLDVWLIYNCENCKTSWNSTILSRVRSKKIDSELLYRFHANDDYLAMMYGADKGILKRNSANIKAIEYEIIGECFDIDTPTVLQVHCDFPLDVKLSTILKDELKLSNAKLKQLLENGCIRSKHGDFSKEKLNGNNTVFFNIKSGQEV